MRTTNKEKGSKNMEITKSLENNYWMNRKSGVIYSVYLSTYRSGYTLTTCNTKVERYYAHYDNNIIDEGKFLNLGEGDDWMYCKDTFNTFKYALHCYKSNNRMLKRNPEGCFIGGDRVEYKCALEAVLGAYISSEGSNDWFGTYEALELALEKEVA